MWKALALLQPGHPSTLLGRERMTTSCSWWCVSKGHDGFPISLDSEAPAPPFSCSAELDGIVLRTS